MKKILSLGSLMLMVLLGVTMSTTSCKKKENTPIVEDKYGTLKIRFDYVFGASQKPFQLNKEMVHPKTGDTMTFTNLKYYVSNIRLKNADGSWWIQPNSYFLLDAKTAGESTIMLTNIPEGKYTEMQYVMGVDSAMNVSGAHDGALSFTHGMFWDWNSGYIMMKAEGKSPNAPGGNFALHLGGFTGADNIVTTKTADFSANPVSINFSAIKTAVLVANPAKLWHSAPGLDSVYIIHAPGGHAVTMAKDFYNGIYFKGIE